LRGKGNAYRRTRSKEIPQGASGYAKLFQAYHWLGFAAVGVRTNIRDVASVGLCRRDGQRRDVGDIVRAWIIAVEEVEELRNGMTVQRSPSLIGRLTRRSV
jgi:hypothetical protein